MIQKEREIKKGEGDPTGAIAEEERRDLPNSRSRRERRSIERERFPPSSASRSDEEKGKREVSGVRTRGSILNSRSA